MSTCPFCHAAIEEELAVHGGTCPHCFGHVPGEETATDPGEVVRAAQAAADRARAERRQRAPLLVIVPVVLLAVGAAVWSLLPEPEVEALVFDEGEFDIEIDLAEYTEPEAPAEGTTEEAVATAAKPRTPRPKADAPEQLASAGGQPGGSRRPASGGTPEGGVRDLGGPSVGSADGGAASGDILFAAKRTAALLESKDDIQAAVRDLFKGRQARLQLCFERSAKVNEELAGKWRLSFVIQTDGTVRDATAEGLDMADSAFERCLEREMSEWNVYGRLAKDWPVSLPVTFRGGV